MVERLNLEQKMLSSITPQKNKVHYGNMKFFPLKTIQVASSNNPTKKAKGNVHFRDGRFCIFNIFLTILSCFYFYGSPMKEKHNGGL